MGRDGEKSGIAATIYPLSQWERARVRSSGRARYRVTRCRIALFTAASLTQLAVRRRQPASTLSRDPSSDSIQQRSRARRQPIKPFELILKFWPRLGVAIGQIE